MDKVVILVLSTFFLGIFCQMDYEPVRWDQLENVKIDKFEQDCVNFTGCRYTGFVLGTFSFPSFVQPSALGSLNMRVVYCPRGGDCSNTGDWRSYCDLLGYFNRGNSGCNSHKFPCYCQGRGQARVKFYPVLENSLYQIQVEYDYNNERDGVGVVQFSNIFDFIKPADWDPIVKVSQYELQNVKKEIC
ncbi:uncharacterized protein LOC131947002 [Physella acuta]|uniref:uncharacterized protein LOC131947002 n=1 Tax=Physella acuta TaxID=109671 RepID=UPI0027DCF14E|nr:uncharacterized protein LOC131947002 [Physella acuta]XP_059164068.1 uncharacterized protein LOC131947002 [Physella acuta]